MQQSSMPIGASHFHTTGLMNYAAPVQIKMPALSPTMTEGTIIKWLKKEGDKFSPGETLFEVQTDKAVIPFELEEEGIVAKILAGDNSQSVKVGTLVGIFVMPGEDWQNVKFDAASVQPAPSAPAAAPVAQAAPTPSTQPAASTASTATSQGREITLKELESKKIGPVARMLMRAYQIDPNSIKGTGPHGFILKSDVKDYILKNNLLPAKLEHKHESEPASTKSDQVKETLNNLIENNPELDYEDIELTNMRKVIAKRLIMSKTTIPHSYISSSCVLDKVIELRKEMIKNNQKVSINDFLIKALGLALRLVPEFNSNLENDGSYKQLQTVDISIAVATDKGLITPIIKNADKLTVPGIAAEAKNLAEKARNGKLLPHEFQGGSFSLSNLGMFGINNFSAVINPPQVAIMAVGKSQQKFNEHMKVETSLSFTISYDERCVSLDRAFKFANTFSYLLSNPTLLNEQSQTF